MAGNQRRFFDPPTEEERKFWGETASDVMAVPSKAASLLQPGWSMLADALTDFLPGQKAQAQAQPLPRPQVKPQTIESPAATSPAAQPQALAAAITERPPAPPPRVRSEAVTSRRLPPGEHWQDTPFPEGRHWTSADTQPGRLPQISSLPDPEGTGSSTFMPATPQFGPGASAQNMFRKAVEDAAPGVYAQKNQGATEAELLPGKTTYAKLWGGDQVSSAETEMDTARKELGSFGDSAGKWWSVLLAAMFPQYGNALNMMEGFKRNKYLAARDKYNTAMEAAMKEDQLRMRYGPPTVHDLKDGYRMVNGQLMHPERKQYETIMTMGPDGPVSRMIEKGAESDFGIDVPALPSEGIYGFQSDEKIRKRGVPEQTFNTIYRGESATDRVRLMDALRDENRAADQANRIDIIEQRGDIQRDLKELEAKYRVRWTSGDEQTLNRILSESEQYRDAPPPQQRAMKAAVMEEMMSRKRQGSPATAAAPGGAQPQPQKKGAIATIP